MKDFATYYWIKGLLIGAEVLGMVAEMSNDLSRALANRAQDLTQEEAERLGMSPKATEDEKRTHH